MTVRNISGAVNTKRLGAYFKKAHKTEDIFVEKSEEVYLSDRLILVRTFPVAEISLFIPQEYEKACYSHGNDYPEPSTSSMKNGWDMFQQYPILVELEATRYLYECYAVKRTATYYRKLVTKDEAKREILVNRAMLDIFSLDGDNLDEFLLELLDNGRGGMVRISARYGHVAFAMPFLPRY